MALQVSQKGHFALTGLKPYAQIIQHSTNASNYNENRLSLTIKADPVFSGMVICEANNDLFTGFPRIDDLDQAIKRLDNYQLAHLAAEYNHGS